MPDNPAAICSMCRGQRYCPTCLGWSDLEVPCPTCQNTGDCPECDATGERQD